MRMRGAYPHDEGQPSSGMLLVALQESAGFLASRYTSCCAACLRMHWVASPEADVGESETSTTELYARLIVAG